MAGTKVVFDEATENTNYTAISLTMNSNKAVQESDSKDLTDRFRIKLRHDLLGDADALSKVFGDSKLIKRIEAGHFGGEVGGKFHRYHMNLHVSILHHVPRYSIIKLAKRLAEWLNENDDILNAKSWYVHAANDAGKRKNYNNKEARWKKNDQVERNPDFVDEIDRLSHDLSQMTITQQNGKTKRVLQAKS
jgi:hypothetical protein